MKSYSESYKAAGVDITAGYKAVELMKAHIARTKNEGCLDDVGGFGGCFGLPTGYEEPVLVSGTDGCGTKVKMAILMPKQIIHASPNIAPDRGDFRIKKR